MTLFALLLFFADVSAAWPDQLLVQKATRVPAKDLLAPKRPVRKPHVPLEGTIHDYVGAVAHTNGVGKVTRVGLVRCTRDRAARCVEIVSEACPKDERPGEGCEGMELTVVVNITADPPKLDRAVGGMGPVRDQADIEKQLAAAP
jgi:hypothetical protein